jgi:hypothetical protein
MRGNKQQEFTNISFVAILADKNIQIYYTTHSYGHVTHHHHQNRFNILLYATKEEHFSLPYPLHSLARQSAPAAAAPSRGGPSMLTQLKGCIRTIQATTTITTRANGVKLFL